MKEDGILNEIDIKNILNKRKWKKIANDLKDDNLEEEAEEEENFSKNYKESLRKYGKKLNSKWDESGQIEYTPFNLKEEMQEGDLDKEGNFLRRKTNNSEYDPWYESIKGDLKKKEYINFLNKQKESEPFKKLIEEDDNQSEDEEERKPKEEENPLSKEEKFFRNAKKIEKKKKSFKFMNELDEDEDDDDDELGEFFKEQEQTPQDKFEIKKQIKRLRIKLLRLIEKDLTVEKTLQVLKKNKEIPKVKKVFQKRKDKEEKKQKEDDISIENITNIRESQSKSEDKTSESKAGIKADLPEKDTRFEEILDLISKLTELQHYTVYSDSAEKIEKEYPMIKYDFYYKTDYKNKNNTNDQEFGPFDWESITQWVDNNLLNDTEEYSISFKVKGSNFETNWFNRDD